MLFLLMQSILKLTYAWESNTFPGVLIGVDEEAGVPH